MMQPATIPNLDASEQGFTLDTGESVAVSVVAQPYGANDTTVNVLVRARIVNAADGSTMQVGGRDVHPPGYMCGVLADTLANGADLTALVANAMTDQAVKARGFHAALTSLASIAPAAGT